MTPQQVSDSFGVRSKLDTPAGSLDYFSLEELEKRGFGAISRLPFSIKVLLESVLRSENGVEVTRGDVEHLANYNPRGGATVEMAFNPARVLLQDFTGVPAVVDLAALRSAMARMGGDPQRINPLIPVDLVIDHSVQVDVFGSSDAARRNTELEFKRNRERYEFLRWGQNAFDNFRVVPPSSGICHQVNLEYLGVVVQQRDGVAFPDSLIGTDSHTPMINGLGVLGWGVGGIEAEACMLGQPIYMLIPEVVGVRLTGALQPGVTATDLVLTVTQTLRRHGVVGRFVEYFGAGLERLTVADRATLANMSPEYGATIGLTPVDDRTLEYLRQTGRPPKLVDLVERYCKAQGLFRTADSPEAEYTDVVELDLSSVEPSLAGPKRPQDRTPLAKLQENFRRSLTASPQQQGFGLPADAVKAEVPVKYPDASEGKLKAGDVCIAAITSCTNTSNPSVLIAAGLLAKKAVERGLTVKPHVKTSLAPGSRVVTEYLQAAGLTPYLDKLGFNLVGYGCTTCIGNSGPLPGHIVEAVQSGELVVASVLSGNRNFTGRINPHTKASYLASPPLVVAFALAGTVDIDLTTEPLGVDKQGEKVFLKDIWPDDGEVAALLEHARDPQIFRRSYEGIEQSNEDWNRIEAGDEPVYRWSGESTYIQEPPFFQDMPLEPEPISPIVDARVLVKAGDSITTDHISPAGVIPQDGPAGQHLISLGVRPQDFNSFGSRRGNDRVMTRGTFGNIMFRNDLGQGREGGWTTYFPTNELTTVFEASQRYQSDGTPTIVIGGADYGMGSSRDWAAKGTYLLGVKAVIAKSFERIHRTNLVCMGVLPLEFQPGQDADALKLSGKEKFTIHLDGELQPKQEVKVEVVDGIGNLREFFAVARLDSTVEVEYYRHGGILQAVLRGFLKESQG